MAEPKTNIAPGSVNCPMVVRVCAGTPESVILQSTSTTETKQEIIQGLIREMPSFFKRALSETTSPSFLLASSITPMVHVARVEGILKIAPYTTASGPKMTFSKGNPITDTLLNTIRYSSVPRVRSSEETKCPITIAISVTNK